MKKPDAHERMEAFPTSQIDLLPLTACFQYYDPEQNLIGEYKGRPTLKMPVYVVQTRRRDNPLGKSKLIVCMTALPSVLAFLESGGTSTDPSIVSNELLEAVINHLQKWCKPKEDNHDNSTTENM